MYVHYKHPKYIDVISFLNPITYLIFIYFFFNYTLASTLNKKIILFCTIFYLSIQIIPFIFKTELFLNSIITTLNTVFILLFCLLYFFEQVRFPKTIFIYTQSAFWNIVGFLVFSAGTFFIFWYNNIINNSQDFNNQYMIIHGMVFLIRNLLFSVAFTIKQDRQRLSDNHLSLT